MYELPKEKKLKTGDRTTYSNVEVDVVDGCEGSSDNVGTDGNLSPICCSATADASCKILSVSSFEALDSMLKESSEIESTISPFSV